MNSSLSPNTKAILLLTAPLIVGRGTNSSELLTGNEYKRLARVLFDKKRQPADLLSTTGDDLLRECQQVANYNRLKKLLERGFLLSQAMERWQARAIWVVSRADANYPKKLRSHLKEDAPPVLYGCGDMSFLDSGGLAVVGSRNVDNELISYTEGIGRLTATAGRSVVSGGARGIDQAAMSGALDAGGRVIGVLAENLERAAMNRENRKYLMSDHLVLVSAYDPNAGFNVGHAMQRNKLIYALADAALVVSSDYEKGGTWSGAAEQLDKLKYVTVFVRSSGIPNKGLDGLLRKGALAWPNPSTPEKLVDTLCIEVLKEPSAPIHDDLLSYANVSPSPPLSPPITDAIITHEISKPSSDDRIQCIGEELFKKVKELLLLLPDSYTELEMAAILNVSKNQIKEWLERAIKECWIEKHGKPARYSVIKDLLPGLFKNTP